MNPTERFLEEGRPIKAGADRNLALLFRIGLLCNESEVYEEEGIYKVDGDPTEGALIVAAMKAGLNLEEEREHFPSCSSSRLNRSGARWPPCIGRRS